MRLAVARGTWQLLMLEAALAEHHLRGEPELPLVVVHGGKRVTPSMRETLTKLGERVPSVRRSAWMDDLTAAFLGADISDDDFAMRVEALRGRIEGEPVEFWTSSPNARQEWLVHRAFPGARVVAYEDGLLMYRGWEAVRPAYESTTRFLRRKVYSQGAGRIAQLLRTELGNRAWGRFGATVGLERTVMRGMQVGVPGYRRRDPELAYLVLPRVLEPNPFYEPIAREIRPEVVRTVLEAHAHDLVGEADAPPAPRALVLSQKFNLGDVRGAEVEAYADGVRKLDAAGFAVYWKEHPRSSEPVRPLLEQAVAPVSVHTLPLDPTLPVELALVKYPVELVVSAWSSSLFYVPLLWGTEAARIEPPPHPRPHHGRHKLTALVRKHLPDLDSWLADRGRR